MIMVNEDGSPLRIHDCLANPGVVPLRRLVGLTRDYYKMSYASVDNYHSNYHRWYYILACECERRGYSLDRVLKGLQ